jgi:hypothetical protein
VPGKLAVEAQAVFFTFHDQFQIQADVLAAGADVPFLKGVLSFSYAFLCRKAKGFALNADDFVLPLAGIVYLRLTTCINQWYPFHAGAYTVWANETHEKLVTS